jgi:hypothetical protein
VHEFSYISHWTSANRFALLKGNGKVRREARVSPSLHGPDGKNAPRGGITIPFATRGVADAFVYSI